MMPALRTPAVRARKALFDHTMNCEACEDCRRCLTGAVLEYEARILIRQAEWAAKGVES